MTIIRRRLSIENRHDERRCQSTCGTVTEQTRFDGHPSTHAVYVCNFRERGLFVCNQRRLFGYVLFCKRLVFLVSFQLIILILYMNIIIILQIYNESK